MEESFATAALQNDPASDKTWMDDPLWYKDAIVYEVHVKAFFDSNGDGIGDFKGLTEKLDYIQSLGVNTIWLLPFYPSPLKDDGYDIADYRNVHPDYGSRKDFAHFVREAHRRELRIITELVINHTSDQHPWFQAARRAPPASSKRNFYVWSNRADKFARARIIFSDTETSNWAWDALTHMYYWHRFFSHQPDLNYDNPNVLKVVIRVMRFWFDMGVDGLRLDAIPYLCVREGTTGENLPETHAVLKEIRAVVDAHYRNRMLLAEANQWPEDVRDYFGNGDECHMAYHFPLMPRIYMAIAQEDRHPIVEIMQQTPDIPASCQWAIFLRNHDELTLEMVTSSERDYMYKMYAADPRARLNLGIRRRLATLMDNNQDKIKLMNSLLLSLPGTPIIYYGDEIGMGDNVYLGDRDGVRTPMQWSPDRNAGFSRADPQCLSLPPIMDAVYGYHVVNVEAQLRNPSSLLSWMRRMLAIRKQYHAFGRGTLLFMRPANRKVLAYLREYVDESVLCVVNLARSAQAVELNLERQHGYVPVEMMGHAVFPIIGESPYQLTLPGYGFYWFLLTKGEDAITQREEHLSGEELPTLVLFDGWNSFFSDRVVPWRIALAERIRAQLENEVLPQFVSVQRWHAAHDVMLQKVMLVDCVEFGLQSDSSTDWLMAIFRTENTGDKSNSPDGKQTYFLPLALKWEDSVDETRLRGLLSIAVAKVRQQAKVGILLDAFADESFCQALLAAFGSNRRLSCGHGTIHFASTNAYADLVGPDAAALSVTLRSPQGSNTAVDLGGRLFLKGYRRLRAGINPEVEIGRFLTEVANFQHCVPVAGTVEYVADQGDPIMLAMLQAYVDNQGDGWTTTLNYLELFFEQCLVPEQSPKSDLDSDTHGGFLTLIQVLGQRTGELHRALALRTGDPAFDPVPIEAVDLQNWVVRIRDEATATFDQLAHGRAQLAGHAQSDAETLLARRASIMLHIEQSLSLRATGLKLRHHGDFHLGQVLLVNNDFVIIDFEGEPGRSLAERRQKHSALRDVAGMLRSFNYAMHIALNNSGAEQLDKTRLIEPHAYRWEAETVRVFIDAYRVAIATATQDTELHGDWGDARLLLDLFVLEKALYELRYELNNRPGWAGIPLRGLVEMTAWS